MWTVYLKYLQWAAVFLRLCLEDVSYKVLNYGQLMQRHKSKFPWNWKTYILNPRALNRNISFFVSSPQETEELFLKLSWFDFPGRKKNMCKASVFTKEHIQWFLFSDQLLFKALAIVWSLLMDWLIGLLVFICNRPCYLLMILWPRKILSQSFHHCQTTYLKMKKLWGLSA